jgi:FtsZ-interacting cell division protein ZipA
MNYTLFIILVIILIIYILSLIFVGTFSIKLFNKRFDKKNIDQDISKLNESGGEDFEQHKNQPTFRTLVFIVLSITLFFR